MHYCAGLSDSPEGVCTVKHDSGSTCDPRDVDSCRFAEGVERFPYCSVDGRCERHWPTACELSALRPDFYVHADWVPYE
jgi:hypothetical protein